MKPEQIKSALESLDLDDDNSWTSDGAPRLDAVGKGVTRQEIQSVAPYFTRSHPSFDLPEGLEPKVEVEEVRPQEADIPKPQHILEMESNLAYLASQQEVRKNRMARTRQVNAALAGGPIGRSPIDQKIAQTNRAARRGRMG